MKKLVCVLLALAGGVTGFAADGNSGKETVIPYYDIRVISEFTMRLVSSGRLPRKADRSIRRRKLCVCEPMSTELAFSSCMKSGHGTISSSR